MRKATVFGLAAILLLMGCASTHPDRLVVPASDEFTLYARGLSTDQLIEEEADASAILNARNELASAIEAKINSLTKRAREQIGVGKDAELNSQYSSAVKQTVSQTLNFSTLYKAHTTVWDKKVNGFRAEVIYKVSIGPINQKLMENIKQRQNLYERFRTTQLFDELEKEIEKSKNP